MLLPAPYISFSSIIILISGKKNSAKNDHYFCFNAAQSQHRPLVDNADFLAECSFIYSPFRYAPFFLARTSFD